MTTLLKSGGCVLASDKEQILCKAPAIFSSSVTKQIFTNDEVSRTGQSPVLPQGLAVVRGLVSAKFSVRVLAYLAEAEQKTEVATEQQCYRIAWLTVLRADEGNLDPWRQAFWEIVGNTPEKTIPFWMARADLFADEYVPLSMIDLKYTRDWGSDYIRAKMAADAARMAELPPKKPVTSLPDFGTVVEIRKAKKRERSKGISIWSALVFAVGAAAALVLVLAPRTRNIYSYRYPDNYLRVLQNLDECKSDGSCGYRFVLQNVQRTASGQVVFGQPTEMHFCKSMQPRFEAGHTLSWIRYADIGSCLAIEGYDTVKGADGLSTLPDNCKPDYSTAPEAGHIACEGGKARF